MKRVPIITLGALGVCLASQGAERPNVVIIYADDLGYGDVQCYNNDSKTLTPNIDKLAENGVRFTDAHSPSSISGPSRYALLTGCYSWRTPLKRMNPATGEDLRVEPDRETIASVFTAEGYNAAAIGKWGLGGNWSKAAREGREGLDVSPEAIDYSKPIEGALAMGFTYESIHRWFSSKYGVTKYPSSYEQGARKYNDGARWYFENGMSRDGDPAWESFDMREAQMYYIEKTVEYIRANGGKGENPAFNLKEDAPFFVYYAPHIPHLPHVPDEQFQGVTELGIYGDFIYQLDWAVGQIVEALEEIGQLENTMIIFASDNGPERHVYNLIESHDHRSMGDLRGVKRDLYQGGHNTPFIVSYPAAVAKGVVSDRLVSQTDLLATCADLIGGDYNRKQAEDSFSFIDELIPSANVERKRDIAIHHSANGNLALRDGDWMLILGDSGSDSAEPEWFREELGAELIETPYGLFNLKDDPRQTKNLYNDYPDIVEKMRAELFYYVYEGGTANVKPYVE